MQYSKEILQKYMGDITKSGRNEFLPRLITEILEEKEQIPIDFSPDTNANGVLEADIFAMYTEEPEMLFVDNPNYLQEFNDFTLFYYEENHPLQYFAKSKDGNLKGYGRYEFQFNVNDDFKDIRIQEDVDKFLDMCQYLSMYDGKVCIPYGAITINNR